MQAVAGSLALISTLSLLVSDDLTIEQARNYAERYIYQLSVEQGESVIPDNLIRSLKRSISRSNHFGKIGKMQLFGMVKDAITTEFLGGESVSNPLPLNIGSLNEYDLARVFYLASVNQTNGWTCGYRAVMAAAALDLLVREEPDRLSHADLNGRAVHFFAENPQITGCLAHINSFLPADQDRVAEGTHALGEHLAILAGMPLLNLPQDNVHIVGDFHRGMHIVGGAPGIYFDPSDAILSGLGHVLGSVDPAVLQGIIEQAISEHFLNNYVRLNRSGAHHFICHMLAPTRHWILISVVKLRNKQPFLIVLDSYNHAINTSSDAATLIPFFYEKFIRPYNRH